MLRLWDTKPPLFRHVSLETSSDASSQILPLAYDYEITTYYKHTIQLGSANVKVLAIFMYILYPKKFSCFTVC